LLQKAETLISLALIHRSSASFPAQIFTD